MPRAGFSVGFVEGTALVSPLPSAAALLAMLRARPEWDAMSIEPAQGEFPRAVLTNHGEHGFVVQCFEGPGAWSDLLVRSTSFSTPEIEVELGGQAVEIWPRELFAPESLAAEALAHFLACGKQKPDLKWARIDQFHRIAVDECGRSAPP